MNTRWIVALAAMVGLLLLVLNLFYGELNQDEGWYLYAGKQVAEGRLPYQDFAFTQGPVFARVYAMAYPLVDRYGVMGGRLFTALLGLIAIGLASGLAARLSPAEDRIWAATATAVLLLANVYHSYFSLVVKTYSLTAVLLTGAALVLTFRPSKGGLAMAGFLFALAAGVRVSAGIWLPVVGLWLVWQRRSFQQGWLFFGLGGLAGLTWAFGPAFLRAPAETWFWLVGYHAERDVSSLLSLLVFKAAFLSRFAQAYFVILLVLLVGLFVRSSHGELFRTPLWMGVLLLSLLHFMAPFPYDDYQVAVMPIVAALAVSTLTGSALVASWRSQLLSGFFLLATVTAFASPMNQQWFERERDRIWWRLKDQPDLVVLQETGRWLAEQAGGQGELLTQDLYLAVEAGLSVPPGWEMGPFSYYPDWSTERAERLHVMNRERLEQVLLTSEAEWVALSGYGLAIASPAVTEVSAEDQAHFRELILQRYQPVKTVPHFGQALTTLELYQRHR